MNRSKKAAIALSNARAALLITHFFYGSILMYVPFEEDNSENNPTMSVDGVKCYYNVDFVLHINEDELIGVLVHEVMHLIYKHHLRMGARDPKEWNIACDFAINGHVRTAGFKLPVPHWYDASLLSFSAEEIYAMRQRQKQEQGQNQQPGSSGQNQGQNQPQNSQNKAASSPDMGQSGQGAGQGKPSQSSPAQGGHDPRDFGGVKAPVPVWDETGLAEENSRWDKFIRQTIAIATSRNAGKLPGFLERVVEQLNSGEVDWSFIRRFADESFRKKSTWRKANRRFLWSGMTLPGYISDGLRHLIVIIDTSGSIIDKVLNKFGAEIRAILDEDVVDKITVIYTDTKVQQVDVFEFGDEFKLNPVGGGGTDFRKVFAYFDKNITDSSAVVFFTDLVTADFGKKPECPVLWTVYGPKKQYEHYAAKVPFGETMHVGM